MNTNHEDTTEELTLAFPASMSYEDLVLAANGLQAEGWTVQDPDCWGEDAAGNQTISVWR